MKGLASIGRPQEVTDHMIKHSSSYVEAGANVRSQDISSRIGRHDSCTKATTAMMQNVRSALTLALLVGLVSLVAGLVPELAGLVLSLASSVLGIALGLLCLVLGLAKQLSSLLLSSLQVSLGLTLGLASLVLGLVAELASLVLGLASSVLQDNKFSAQTAWVFGTLTGE